MEKKKKIVKEYQGFPRFPKETDYEYEHRFEMKQHEESSAWGISRFNCNSGWMWQPKAPFLH